MNMRRYLNLVVLLLAMLPLFCRAQNAGQQFKQANDLYTKQHYKEAVVAYQQLTSAGYHSAALYYNLGNAYYKTGDIASAELYFQKAHKLAPGDEDINNNILFINSKTIDKIDAAPQFFLTRWWHGFILWLPADNLAVLSVVLILIASVALVLYLFSNTAKTKKAAFYGALVCLLLGIITMVMANRQVNYFDKHHEAVIFSQAVNVKAGPDGNAKALFIIHNGTLVNVLDQSNGWLKIAMPNGNEGWILVSDAREI